MTLSCAELFDILVAVLLFLPTILFLAILLSKQILQTNNEKTTIVSDHIVGYLLGSHVT